jgi:hypothetical protein
MLGGGGGAATKILKDNQAQHAQSEQQGDDSQGKAFAGGETEEHGGF